MTSRRWRVNLDDRNSLAVVREAPQLRGIVQLTKDSETFDTVTYVTWATQEDIEQGGQFCKGHRGGDTPRLCFTAWVYEPTDSKTPEQTIEDIGEQREEAARAWRDHFLFIEAGSLPMYNYWVSNREQFCILVDLARRNVQFMIQAYSNLRDGGFMETEQAVEWLMSHGAATKIHIDNAKQFKDSWEEATYSPPNQVMTDIIEFVANRGGQFPPSLCCTLIYREMKALEDEIGADVDRWYAVASQFDITKNQKKRRRRLHT